MTCTRQKLGFDLDPFFWVSNKQWETFKVLGNGSKPQLLPAVQLRGRTTHTSLGTILLTCFTQMNNKQQKILQFSIEWVFVLETFPTVG